MEILCSREKHAQLDQVVGDRVGRNVRIDRHDAGAGSAIADTGGIDLLASDYRPGNNLRGEAR